MNTAATHRGEHAPQRDRSDRDDWSHDECVRYARLGELDAGLPTVAYCHTGVRSLRAAEILTGAGYRSLSLAGGVAAWAREVDPAMARY